MQIYHIRSVVHTVLISAIALLVLFSLMTPAKAGDGISDIFFIVVHLKFILRNLTVYVNIKSDVFINFDTILFDFNCLL